VIAGRLARWHFAPAEGSRQSLLPEGVQDSAIAVTGNTVVDALLMTYEWNVEVGIPLDADKRLVLVTSHRRGNFGEPFRNVCRALQTLAERNPGVQFLYPVHPDPNVKDVAHEVLGASANISLCEPLDYAPFVAVMKKSCLILTDSGGVREEAPALGKPVLVLRDETEWPEKVAEGVVKFSGPHYERVVGTAGEQLGQLDCRLHGHLFEDPCPVHFDGAHGDVKLRGDDLVVLTGENSFHHLAFSLAETLQPTLYRC
jgi:UDP-N-acetylglucosamine 2-epimerase (non-hydrolysing)